jgi:hypothetical protein
MGGNAYGTVPPRIGIVQRAMRPKPAKAKQPRVKRRAPAKRMGY